MSETHGGPHPNCLQCEDIEIARLVAAGVDEHWAILRVIDQRNRAMFERPLPNPPVDGL